MYVLKTYVSKNEHPNLKSATEAYALVEEELNVNILPGYETVKRIPIKETTVIGRTIHHDYDHHYYIENDDSWNFDLIIIGD